MCHQNQIEKVSCCENVCVISKSKREKCFYAITTAAAANSWVCIPVYRNGDNVCNHVALFVNSLLRKQCKYFVILCVIFFWNLKRLYVEQCKKIIVLKGIWTKNKDESQRTHTQSKWITIIRIRLTITMAKSRSIGFLHCQKIHRFDNGQRIYFHHKISSNWIFYFLFKCLNLNEWKIRNL